MSELTKLKLGDVVVLPSNPEVLMTVTYIGTDSHIDNVTYFNGGVLIKSRVNFGAIRKIDDIDDRNYIISVLQTLAKKQNEMIEKLVDTFSVS